MHLKGIEKFRAKLPALSGKKILILPFYWIFWMGMTFLMMILLANLPEIDSPMSVIYPIIGLILIESMAIFLVYQMWYWKDRFKTKYGQTSYQRIFLIGFAGIIIMITLAINNLLPIFLFDRDLWSINPFRIWGSPINELIGLNWIGWNIICDIVGILIAVIGFRTIFRSIMTFGFDYMTVVYLYFPEESEIQNHEIYSVLRHPTYGALIYICFGGFLIQFSLLSFIYFIIYVIGFFIHIRFVEERELLIRFGEGYRTYMKSVPAIFVQPKNLPKFFRFLIGAK